jgi:hypothetical protein
MSADVPSGVLTYDVGLVYEAHTSGRQRFNVSTPEMLLPRVSVLPELPQISVPGGGPLRSYLHW